MSNRVEKFYNRISFFYPLINIFIGTQKKRLIDEINCLPGGSLLEIGVGQGRYLHLYRGHKITAIDISDAMLGKAKLKMQAHIRLFRMDGENMEFQDEQFNYVVLSHVIAVTNDPEKLMAEVHRVLKTGGKVFILNHFTPANNLKYLDRFFNRFSGRFHFKSLFELKMIRAIEKFSLASETELGKMAYYKLVTLNKL
jgi:phosphatidylethanolamine/phosphatidyl-N-methylethanolamine N-methyltransferase